MEKVERRATKFIVKNDDPCDIRLKKLNLMSLEKRRLLADVTFLCKALKGKINIDVHSYIEFYSTGDRHSLRHKDNLTLKKKYARTNVLKYSFFHRISDTWNLLPIETHSATTVNMFKARAKRFFMEL